MNMNINKVSRISNSLNWTNIWSTDICNAIVEGTISAQVARNEALKDLDRGYITVGLFNRVEDELNGLMF